MSAKTRVLPLSAAQKKSITLLGATGTIGQNTLKIVAAHPDRFSVTALTAGDNVALLAEQAKKFRPKRAVIANAARYNELKELLKDTDIEAAAGDDAVLEAAAMPTDIVMSAIVGAAGLKPTLAAIRSGTTVALANKECLVCAGALMTKEVKKYGATLIPVDSEHNAAIKRFVGGFVGDFGHRGTVLVANSQYCNSLVTICASMY